jgi:hypothetical protein
MKSISDYFLIPSFFIGVYSLYSINKLFNKNKQLENDIETILKTHLNYMEKQESIQHDINDIYDMFEGVAGSIPFTSKHEWQNKMLQRKLKREADKYDDEEQREINNNKWKEEEMKFYDYDEWCKVKNITPLNPI